MHDTANNDKDYEKYTKKSDKDIEKIEQSDLDELKGRSFDEIFKLFSGYELPTNENDEIKIAKKLKTTRFRLKICISIITKNKIIANYVKFLQFFNAKYLQTIILAIEGIKIPYSTIWSFLQGMVKAGFLFERKITFKSAHKLKKYRNGILYFWVKNCPEKAKRKMYEHLEEDKFLYSKEMKLLEIKQLELKIKSKKKAPKEIVGHNIEVKRESIIAEERFNKEEKQRLIDKSKCEHGKMPNECGEIESCPNYRWKRLNRSSEDNNF